MYPSLYEGVMLSNSFSFKSTVNVLLNFNKTIIPGFVFFKEFDTIELYRSFFERDYKFIIGNIIKAIIIVITFIFATKRLPIISAKKLISVSIIFLVAIFLPHFILSLTVKYQQYATTFNGYVTSFWSFFAFAAFLTTTFVLLYQHCCKDKYAKILLYSYLCFIIFFMILISFSNKAMSRDYQISNARIFALDKFAKSEDAKVLKEEDILYAPLLWQSKAIYEKHLHGGWEAAFQRYLNSNLDVSVFVCKTIEQVEKLKKRYPEATVYDLIYTENIITMEGDIELNKIGR